MTINARLFARQEMLRQPIEEADIAWARMRGTAALDPDVIMNPAVLRPSAVASDAGV
jgi:hypothetical protein